MRIIMMKALTKVYLAFITALCKGAGFHIEYVLYNYCSNKEEQEYVRSIWNS